MAQMFQHFVKNIVNKSALARPLYRQIQRASTMSEQKTIIPPQFYRRVLPSTCISFSSQKGKEIFAESLSAGHMEGYFSLAAQFRTQDEPAFCGLSTLVMALNTLEVDPKKVWKGVWRWYHESMLDCCVPLEVAQKTGITFDQFACLASCNTLNVVLMRADDSLALETFRTAVKFVTRRDDQVIVVSYSRQVLGQTGEGHFSPIGGYHVESDRVLILDTARFKYPPHWVSLPLLFEAMKAKDKDTGLSRGYMLLSKGSNLPLVLFRVSSMLSIPLPSSTNAATSGLETFLNEWSKWLVSTDNLQGEELVEQAVYHLVKAAGHFGEGECLLTTLVDTTCRDSMSPEHSCMVQELISLLDNLPMFSEVRQLVNGKFSHFFTHKLGQCAETRQACTLLDNDMPDSGEPPMKRMCKLGKLEPAHFVTALLLAWPYFKCDQSNGVFLQRMAMTQLSQSSTLLQGEIAQLKQQLGSVLGFMESCQSKTCNKCA